jgi:hypothetical protein
MQVLLLLPLLPAVQATLVRCPIVVLVVQQASAAVLLLQLLLLLLHCCGWRARAQPAASVAAAAVIWDALLDPQQNCLLLCAADGTA